MVAWCGSAQPGSESGKTLLARELAYTAGAPPRAWYKSGCREVRRTRSAPRPAVANAVPNGVRRAGRVRKRCLRPCRQRRGLRFVCSSDARWLTSTQATHYVAGSAGGRSRRYQEARQAHRGRELFRGRGRGRGQSQGQGLTPIHPGGHVSGEQWWYLALSLGDARRCYGRGLSPLLGHAPGRRCWRL